MRKLLTDRLLVAIGLSIALTGCGSSPTAPTSTGGSQTTSGSPAPTPAPEPSPAPSPAPAPAPTPAPSPAPAPAPAPAPSPAPVSVWMFDGSTDHAYWFGTPLLPEHFELVITDGSVKAGDHSFPILSQAPGNVYVTAGTRSVETLTVEYHGPTDGSGSWSWTYSGQVGQATGSLNRK